MSRIDEQLREENTKVEPFFRRDSRMYTDFERQCKSYEYQKGHIAYISHILARECDSRTRESFEFMRKHILKGEDPYLFLDQNREKPFRDFSSFNTRSIYRKNISSFYLSIGEYEIINQYDSVFSDPPYYSEEEKSLMQKKHLDFIHKYDDIALKTLSNIPIIFDKNYIISDFAYKTAFIELDFSKPVNELLARVMTLKSEFDNNPDLIQSANEFLALEPKREVFKEQDIYTHKHKPRHGKYADILFIYDCHCMGLTQKYACEQIDFYWEVMQNHSQDKISPHTHQKYLKLAQKYIDEKHYLSIIQGTRQ